MASRRAVCGLVLIGLVISVVLGCREEVPPLFRRNRAPETTLSIVAEESTLALYEYHVYWKGEDPDGEVVRYLFAITDTLSEDEEENWNPEFAVDRERGVFTAKTDSIFLFNSEVGEQAFNIVSIDDFGEPDPSPARRFFKVTDRGTPRIRFLDVVSDAADHVPCVSTDPCTIPMYANFHVRFLGTSANSQTGYVQGITWTAGIAPWEPYGTPQDTFFLPSPGNASGVQTSGGPWEQHGDTVTAYYLNPREPATSSFQGGFLLHVNGRDQARRMVIAQQGDRLITVNYDPQTRLYRMSACDCPKPPPNCSPGDSVPVGWVTGIGLRTFPRDQWRPFCRGDTLSNQSKVTFYADGFDDERDGAKDPVAGLADTKYKFRFTYAGAGGTVNTSMPFSVPSVSPSLLPLPGGGTFSGAQVGWTVCPFNYTFVAAAEDEQARIDGTPADLTFFAGFSPQMDSLYVGTLRADNSPRPKVMVFVPNCGPIFSFLCPNPGLVSFGQDTIAVFPTHVPANPGETPLDLGRNRFVFPFKGWGHDNPGDKNPTTGLPYYNTAEEGQIRAWYYTFDCTTPLCEDHVLLGEKVWRREERVFGDPPRQEVFDEGLSLLVNVDTLCVGSTTAPCPFPNVRGALNFTRFGDYVLTLQGRDTPPSGLTCPVPPTLNPGETATSQIDISAEGRTTQIFSVPIVWRQYADVRLRKPQTESPFANHKRLMR